MTAVEIGASLCSLDLQPFDAAESSFQLITDLGVKKATVDRLRATNNGTDQSDIRGVLQRNTIPRVESGIDEQERRSSQATCRS